MCKSILICLAILAATAQLGGAKLLDIESLRNYTRLLGFGEAEGNNELWRGIIRDCSKRVSFSCIQKNAYSYLDSTLMDTGNVTLFDGFSLVRNNLDYEAACIKDDPKSNLVEEEVEEVEEGKDKDGKVESEEGRNEKGRKFEEGENAIEDEEEDLSPLEEVTHALRSKAVKFLATRDYEIQLPRFIGAGAGIKISPREIDERGALVRIDFDTRAIEEQFERREQGRLFFIKKIKKHIQNKLFTGLLLLILLIKIIKLKFMFVIPFLFGVGTAKKLFLKLLLFLVPAFAHVFKLCSSYYTSFGGTKYHHHHHKIAHHHHHIPVPVPVPSYSSKPHSSPIYFDHPPISSDSPPDSFPSHPDFHSSGPPPYILDEDFPGYDYAHPHIQYRKDIEELREWGIEPYDDSYDQPPPVASYPPSKPSPKISSSGPLSPNSLPPSFPNKPPPPPFPGKLPPALHAQTMAYGAYAPPPPKLPPGVVAAPHFLPPPPKPQPPKQPVVVSYPQHQQQKQQPLQQQPLHHQQQQQSRPSQTRNPQQSALVAVPPSTSAVNAGKQYDDEFYGPMVERLDETFNQLRFLDENCRERLVCSMYKNPALYAPHSNLVSNELSRDPQELQQGNSASHSSQRFLRYLNAARIGQDGGDCLRSFHCNINTE